MIPYKDALEKHGCLDLKDLQYEAEFLTWDQASQNTFTFACHLTSTIGIRVSWDPFNPDWNSRTQEIVSKWIQLLHKHPAHLHALDMKDAPKQRDPGIKPLAGITTSKLADKYIIKRN